MAQEFTAVDPVTSVSCEQAERTVTMATREIRMIIVRALLMRLGFTHPQALARRRLSFPTTRSLFAGRPPLLPPFAFPEAIVDLIRGCDHILRFCTVILLDEREISSSPGGSLSLRPVPKNSRLSDDDLNRLKPDTAPP